MGVAAGAPWPPRSAARSRARRGSAELDPSLGALHPGALGAARIRGLRERERWRWFGASTQPPVGGGIPRGRSKQGPSSTSTHTHTCWATSSDHSGASSSPRAPGGPDHGHTYTHTYICAHRHTSRTPAPAGAPSLAENPLQRLHTQQHGHTTCGPTKQ